MVLLFATDGLTLNEEAAVICGWRIARGWRTMAEGDWERWWRCSFGLNIEFNVQHHLQERDENEDEDGWSKHDLSLWSYIYLYPP